MAKTYDVVVTTGEYKNSKGEMKKKYLTIGAILESEKGLSLKLESIPLGWDGWAALYVPKEKEATPLKAVRKDSFDSDHPF